MKSLLNRPDLQPAARLFAKAAAASRLHSSASADALAIYGDHGSLISGIVRDHFPEPVKTMLRQAARDVTELNAKARALRPARVRMETMHRLAREICRRDGTGFYGYQS